MKLFSSLLFLLLIYSNGVQSQDNCPKWVPTLMEGNDITNYKSPQQAWLKKALVIGENMLKTNPSYSAIPEARLRNTLLINPDGAFIYSAAYIRRGWDKKGCGLIPQADRINAAHGYITMSFNMVGLGFTATEKAYTTNNGTDVFYEPETVGTIAGYPYYSASKYTYLFLFTYNNKPPWVPVTIREYLDRQEEVLHKRIEEHNVNKERNKNKQINVKDEDVKRRYELLKKTSSTAAEGYLKSMEDLKKQQGSINAEMLKKDLHADSLLQNEVEELKQFRATYSPQDLNKQACLCMGINDEKLKYNLCPQGYQSPDTKKLVKMGPEYLTGAKTKKIRVISIDFKKETGEPGWDELIRKTIETLDYKALNDLMK